MASYVKKPLTIEAVQVTAADFNGVDWDGSPFYEFPDWLQIAVQTGLVTPVTPNNTDYAEWEIKTLEGNMLASAGDYIIRGIKGELYPCKSDIFEATYDKV